MTRRAKIRLSILIPLGVFSTCFVAIYLLYGLTGYSMSEVKSYFDDSNYHRYFGEIKNVYDGGSVYFVDTKDEKGNILWRNNYEGVILCSFYLPSNSEIIESLKSFIGSEASFIISDHILFRDTFNHYPIVQLSIGDDELLSYETGKKELTQYVYSRRYFGYWFV